MCALRRNFHRHGRFAPEVLKARGVPGQHGRHIIAKGVSNFRKFKRLNVTKIVPGLHPAELHATKGWRLVPAWT